MVTVHQTKSAFKAKTRFYEKLLHNLWVSISANKFLFCCFFGTKVAKPKLAFGSWEN